MGKQTAEVPFPTLLEKEEILNVSVSFLLTFDYEVDLFCTDFSKHEFLHSEVLYLGHREAGRTDAGQMLFQVLSEELDNRSLGNCTA